MLSLVRKCQLPPTIGTRFNWSIISRESGIEDSKLLENKSAIRGALYLVCGHINAAKFRDADRKDRVLPVHLQFVGEISDEFAELTQIIRAATIRMEALCSNLTSANSGTMLLTSNSANSIEHFEASNTNFPTPLPQDNSFPYKLSQLLSKNDLSIEALIDNLNPNFGRVNAKLIREWLTGTTIPRNLRSMKIISAIESAWGEDEYCLLAYINNFSAKSYVLTKYFDKRRDRDIIMSHLPDNYWFASEDERLRINKWMKENMLGGATEYRRYSRAASSIPFQIKLGKEPLVQSNAGIGPQSDPSEALTNLGAPAPHIIPAPPRLQLEFCQLISFKTSSISDGNYKRSGTWNDSTADLIRLNFGLLFGALHAPADGPVQGLGVPQDNLALALLVFPGLWDWYLQWRKDRRGSFNAAEITILNYARGWHRRKTGWIAQNPSLIDNVKPIVDQRTQKTIVSLSEIERARSNWKSACKKIYKRLLQLVRDVRGHIEKARNSFDAIRTVLHSEEPMRVYKKIADEILLRPVALASGKFGQAEKVRSYLMIRIPCEIGSRSKNLRQLLVCPRGKRPHSLNELSALKRGEFRWSDEENAWEVIIPKSAFKNSRSKYFKLGPFRKVFKYDTILYDMIDAYINIHRLTLLNGRKDSGTFFVTRPKGGIGDASYGCQTFYTAYANIIRTYGIYNPFTGKGAIAGLLPHGPHSVRDVRATHMLKITGSYEQAAYSIQDDPITVELHYAEFGPHDREKIVSKVLDPIWDMRAA